MHIIYGVSGEGSGHSSRAREVIRHLQRSGHSVSVFTFDRGLRALQDEFDAHEIFGLRLRYKQDQLQVAKTVIDNALRSPQALKSIRAIRQCAKKNNTQLVITDFEPLTVSMAHLMNLPLLSIDNQHRITRTAIEYPDKYESDALSAKAVIELMTPQCDSYIVTNFFDAPTTRKRTSVYPPILRNEILQAQPAEGEHVLVYLTSALDYLPDVLEQIDQQFVVYGVLDGEDRKNVTFKPHSQEGFVADLVNSKAVIATAGFSLMTEALHLGKPMLAMPIAKQFEQILNAYYLERHGYGRYAESLGVEDIEFFLEHLADYKKALKTYKKEDNSELFAGIDSFINTV